MLAHSSIKSEPNISRNLGKAPPYGMRKGWVPRKPEDYGDGGAFPEIHVPQYPLEMGLTPDTSNALTLPDDSDLSARAEMLLRQGHDKDRVIFARPEDAEEKEDLAMKPKPSEEERQKRIDEVRAALHKNLEKQLSESKVVKKDLPKPEANYILYTPAQKSVGYSDGNNVPVQQRIIKMMEVQTDPMEPPRFQINKKIPRGPPSPPPAVLSSPTRSATKREKEMWKIPPCVSNWKNPRGYTVPLANRVAADGRNNQITTKNAKHDALAESLQLAEREARAEIEKKNQLRRRIKENQEKADKEKMQQYAMRVRERQTKGGNRDYDEGEKERNEMRHERQRDRNRERNLNNRGIAQSRLENRDISEQIALGQANPLLHRNQDEYQFDKRLMDKTGGLDSGFKDGADDQYDIYDKPFFTQNKSIYKAPRHAEDGSGADDVSRYKKTFLTEQEAREEPVNFVNDDPFQLTSFLESVKSSTTVGASKRSRDDGSGDKSGGGALPPKNRRR